MEFDVEHLAEVLYEKGKVYPPAPRPAHIPRGRMHHCFDNCITRAIEFGLIYVEGVVISTRDRKVYLHAWLSDGTHAIDPTWRAEDKDHNELPFPGIYIGLAMDVRAVAKFMVATEYAGVLANYWRNPELAEKAAGIKL